MILSPAGGALRKMLLPFRCGLGGALGGGSQWLSWISIHDAVYAVYHALCTRALRGPLNVVSPLPLRNADFTRILAHALHRPACLPLPAAALRLIFGELADETLLASTRAAPVRLLQSGFPFSTPQLEEALRRLLGAERLTPASAPEA